MRPRSGYTIALLVLSAGLAAGLDLGTLDLRVINARSTVLGIVLRSPHPALSNLQANYELVPVKLVI